MVLSLALQTTIRCKGKGAEILKYSPPFSLNPFDAGTNNINLSKSSKCAIFAISIFSALETGLTAVFVFKASLVLSGSLALLVGVVSIYFFANYLKAFKSRELALQTNQPIQIRKVATAEQELKFRQACAAGKEEQALKLIEENGCAGFVVDKANGTPTNQPLLDACLNGLDKVVEKILEASPLSACVRDQNFVNMFHATLDGMAEPAKKSTILKSLCYKASEGILHDTNKDGLTVFDRLLEFNHNNPDRADFSGVAGYLIDMGTHNPFQHRPEAGKPLEFMSIEAARAKLKLWQKYTPVMIKIFNEGRHLRNSLSAFLNHHKVVVNHPLQTSTEELAVLYWIHLVYFVEKDTPNCCQRLLDENRYGQNSFITKIYKHIKDYTPPGFNTLYEASLKATV